MAKLKETFSFFIKLYEKGENYEKQIQSIFLFTYVWITRMILYLLQIIQKLYLRRANRLYI